MSLIPPPDVEPLSREELEKELEQARKDVAAGNYKTLDEQEKHP